MKWFTWILAAGMLLYIYVTEGGRGIGDLFEALIIFFAYSDVINRLERVEKMSRDRRG